MYDIDAITESQHLPRVELIHEISLDQLRLSRRAGYNKERSVESIDYVHCCLTLSCAWNTCNVVCVKVMLIFESLNHRM